MIVVDARGMRCPWPALRLAKAVREAGAGASVRVLADDPAAPREIAALAGQHGWRIEEEDAALIIFA
ncbi:tRNA 2-thiouridine synthesizing protein A [Sphingomonas laterariae]|uniref:tRNA 2-thiouridine synthesizing protein A n=1 Tax=Edaphosphingomonas laterariae TaxID=861865 RepID=A0A239F4J2_9SPHN|nr:tRNA 2-thiouridine synthesizing protein A [Sphingomonas laterariae]